MADVVISEFMDEAAVARLGDTAEVLYDPGLVDRPDDLLAALRSARALIVRNRTQVRGAVLDQAAQLSCVGRLGVGLDNIDMDACAARGIAVYPATGANDLSVAEYVVAMALVLLRGAYGATDAVIAGDWPRQRLMGRESAGKVMGLIGYGSIARAVAVRAAALGMTVVAHDPHVPATDPSWGSVQSVAFDALLSRADVISLHVPLTGSTRGMLDASAITAMKPGAIVINAARGGVVDEAALATALRSGALGGAALDVFDAEPVTADSGRVLADVPNLILTPHIAGVTEEANSRVSHLIADRVIAHLKDIP